MGTGKTVIGYNKRFNWVANGDMENGEPPHQSQFDPNSSANKWSVVELVNPGATNYVLQTIQTNSVNTECQIHPRVGLRKDNLGGAANPLSKSFSGTGLQINTTYTLRCWVAWSGDYNGNTRTLHSRWYKADGTEAGTTSGIPGSGNCDILETRTVGSFTWKHIEESFTTGSDLNGAISFFLGYPTDSTVGERYITGVEMVGGDIASTSNTDGLEPEFTISHQSADKGSSHMTLNNPKVVGLWEYAAESNIVDGAELVPVGVSPAPGKMWVGITQSNVYHCIRNYYNGTDGADMTTVGTTLVDEGIHCYPNMAAHKEYGAGAGGWYTPLQVGYTGVAGKGVVPNFNLILNANQGAPGHICVPESFKAAAEALDILETYTSSDMILFQDSNDAIVQWPITDSFSTGLYIKRDDGKTRVIWENYQFPLYFMILEVPTLDTFVEDHSNVNVRTGTLSGLSAVDTGVSMYKGARVPAWTVTANKAMSVESGGRTVSRADTGAGWDARAVSDNSIAGGCVISFRCGSNMDQPSHHIMMGISTDPTVNHSYNSIDYAWYMEHNDTGPPPIPGEADLKMFESGSSPGTSGYYDSTTLLQIVYDNDYIRYYKDGVKIREVNVASGLTFYAHGAFHGNSTDGSSRTVTDISFSPLSSIDISSDNTEIRIKNSSFNLHTPSILSIGSYTPPATPPPGFKSIAKLIDGDWEVPAGKKWILYSSPNSFSGRTAITNTGAIIDSTTYDASTQSAWNENIDGTASFAAYFKEPKFGIYRPRCHRPHWTNEAETANYDNLITTNSFTDVRNWHACYEGGNAGTNNINCQFFHDGVTGSNDNSMFHRLQSEHNTYGQTTFPAYNTAFPQALYDWQALGSYATSDYFIAAAYENIKQYMDYPTPTTEETWSSVMQDYFSWWNYNIANILVSSGDVLIKGNLLSGVTLTDNIVDDWDDEYSIGSSLPAGTSGDGLYLSYISTQSPLMNYDWDPGAFSTVDYDENQLFGFDADTLNSFSWILFEVPDDSPLSSTENFTREKVNINPTDGVKVIGYTESDDLLGGPNPLGVRYEWVAATAYYGCENSSLNDFGGAADDGKAVCEAAGWIWGDTITSTRATLPIAECSTYYSAVQFYEQSFSIVNGTKYRCRFKAGHNGLSSIQRKMQIKLIQSQSDWHDLAAENDEIFTFKSSRMTYYEKIFTATETTSLGRLDFMLGGGDAALRDSWDGVTVYFEDIELLPMEGSMTNSFDWTKPVLKYCDVFDKLDVDGGREGIFDTYHDLFTSPFFIPDGKKWIFLFQRYEDTYSSYYELGDLDDDLSEQNWEIIKGTERSSGTIQDWNFGAEHRYYPFEEGIPPYSGQEALYFGGYMYSSGPGSSDKWYAQWNAMIMKPIAIPSGETTTLTFANLGRRWDNSGGTQYRDNIEFAGVRVTETYTTGSASASCYECTFQESTDEAWTDVWEHDINGNDNDFYYDGANYQIESVDLSAYAGSTIHIAFVYNTEQAADRHFEWLYDHIKIQSSTSGTIFFDNFFISNSYSFIPGWAANALDPGTNQEWVNPANIITGDHSHFRKIGALAKPTGSSSTLTLTNTLTAGEYDWLKVKYSREEVPFYSHVSHEDTSLGAGETPPAGLWSPDYPVGEAEIGLTIECGEGCEGVPQIVTEEHPCSFALMIYEVSAAQDYSDWPGDIDPATWKGSVLSSVAGPANPGNNTPTADDDIIVTWSSTNSYAANDFVILKLYDENDTELSQHVAYLSAETFNLGTIASNNDYYITATWAVSHTVIEETSATFDVYP